LGEMTVGAMLTSLTGGVAEHANTNDTIATKPILLKNTG